MTARTRTECSPVSFVATSWGRGSCTLQPSRSPLNPQGMRKWVACGATQLKRAHRVWTDVWQASGLSLLSGSGLACTLAARRRRRSTVRAWPRRRRRCSNAAPEHPRRRRRPCRCVAQPRPRAATRPCTARQRRWLHARRGLITVQHIPTHSRHGERSPRPVPWGWMRKDGTLGGEHLSERQCEECGRGICLRWLQLVHAARAAPLWWVSDVYRKRASPCWRRSALWQCAH